MGSIRKNFAYNTFLTVSERFINLLLFPYCARILGVERFGTVSYVQTIAQYFGFFAIMGVITVGAREIAKQRDKAGLNECFSSMIMLSVIFTVLTLAVYFPLIFLVDKFENYKELYFLGGLQILFSSFSIEWFYRGIENFKYITIRSLIVKVVYVILVFIFVRSSSDYVSFWALTVLMVVVNAIVNFVYARKFVSFTLKGLHLDKYLKSTLSLGAYSILTSMYTTFNIAYLGYVWDDTQVGLYTTAIKMYIIILGIYSAFTGVMLPRMSSVVENKDSEQFENLISKSLELLYIISIPMVFFLFAMAPEIIYVLAGTEYMPAVLLSRIVVPMLFVVGFAQVLSFQIIIPKGFDSITFKASILGAVLGLLLNLWLTTQYSAVGTCITVAVTEIVVTAYYYYVVKKNKMVNFDGRCFLKYLIFSVPFLFICILTKMFVNNMVLGLVLASFGCIVYFVISQLYFIKNEQFLIMAGHLGYKKNTI